MNWAPFAVEGAVKKDLPPPRPLETTPGIGDRLRTAAFAELQAEKAFLWAADRFADAPAELRGAWRALAVEERKHRHWLTQRMGELGIAPGERPVSDALWRSLTNCPDARAFCHLMADAEERGRRAGERFHERLSAVDPETARIFGQIALEERAHIALAYRYYPKPLG